MISALKANGVDLPASVESPDFALTPQMVWTMVEVLSWHLFPPLAPADKEIESSEAALKEALGITTPSAVK